MMRYLSGRKKSVNSSPQGLPPLRIGAAPPSRERKPLTQDEENEKNVGNTDNVWSVNVAPANRNNPQNIGNNWDPKIKNYRPGRGDSTGSNLSWANKPFPPSSYISPTRKRSRSANRTQRPNGTIKRIRHMNHRN